MAFSDVGYVCVIFFRMTSREILITSLVTLHIGHSTLCLKMNFTEVWNKLQKLQYYTIFIMYEIPIYL